MVFLVERPFCLSVEKVSRPEPFPSRLVDLHLPFFFSVAFSSLHILSSGLYHFSQRAFQALRIYTDEQMSAPPHRHASIFLPITPSQRLSVLDRRLPFASPTQASKSFFQLIWFRMKLRSWIGLWWMRWGREREEESFICLRAFCLVHGGAPSQACCSDGRWIKEFVI